MHTVLPQYAPVVVSAMQLSSVTGLNCHRERIVISVIHAAEFDGHVMDGVCASVMWVVPAELHAALPHAGAKDHMALWQAMARDGALDQVEERPDWNGRRFLFDDRCGEDLIRLGLDYRDLLAAKKPFTAGALPTVGRPQKNLPNDPGVVADSHDPDSNSQPEIRKARKHLRSLGWSYRSAAPLLGVSYQHLAMVLTGRRESERLMSRLFNLPPRH